MIVEGDRVQRLAGLFEGYSALTQRLIKLCEEMERSEAKQTEVIRDLKARVEALEARR